MDEATNSLNKDYWDDRLGRKRLTWEGMTRLSNLGAAVSAAERAEAAADVAEHTADMRTYFTKAEADAALPMPSGTVIRVTNDPGATNNGYWVSDGSQWIWSGMQPVMRSTIGDFAQSATYVHNWNTINKSGLYRSNPTGQAPIGGPANLAHMLCEHIQGTSGRARQRAYRAGVSDPGHQEWTRTRNSNGEWTEWAALALIRDIEDMRASIGDFAQSATYVHDWNSITKSGLYKSNPTGQAPIGGPANLAHMLCEHIEGTSGRAHQVAFVGVSGSPRSFIRGRSSSGEWTEWVETVSISKDQNFNQANPGRVFRDAGRLALAPAESVDWTASSSTFFTDSVMLNGLYQQLVVDYPEYVSEENLGQDDFGNDIWEFKFSAPGFRWASPATPKNNAHPKIVIVTGTHGSEPTSMISAYLFFKELCSNWQNDERLSELRWGSELVIVPCLNPSGLNAGNRRRNGNDVDFNHNGSYGWEQLVSDYKGAAPLDQPETQISHNLPLRHPTAQTFIDFHAHENVGYNTWVGTRSETGYAILKHMLRKHQAWFYRNFEYGRTGNSSIVAATGTALTGLATDWTYSHNRKGFLLETHLAWPGSNLRNRRRIAVDSLLSLIYENWQAESRETGWVDGAPLP
ncbi:M14 family zinc carboxypeptidase [Alcaligenes faecalis]|uniref:M14 family zinc carboxypeptidase n=1 Tax=Alcaligenes faecalis TaxID=511 RepID=UPI001EEFCFB1|nr:M14 family zinc carboxypeptidase [Alcaligenes faecalis]ULH08241.1 hypothetical protein MF263_07250 [Alcaligenes faecalis]